jgi:hypothetical protein
MLRKELSTEPSLAETMQPSLPIAADSEPMFYGIPRPHCFTTALESLQTLLCAKVLNRRFRK